MKKAVFIIFFGIFIAIAADVAPTEARPQVLSSAPLTPAQAEALNFQWGEQEPGQANESQSAKVYQSYQRDPAELKKHRQAQKEKAEKAEDEPEKAPRERSYHKASAPAQPKTTFGRQSQGYRPKAATAQDSPYASKMTPRPYVRPPAEQSLAQTYHPNNIPAPTAAETSPPGDERDNSYQRSGQKPKKTVITLPAKTENVPGEAATAKAAPPEDKPRYDSPRRRQNRKNNYSHRRSSSAEAGQPARAAEETKTAARPATAGTTTIALPEPAAEKPQSDALKPAPEEAERTAKPTEEKRSKNKNRHSESPQEAPAAPAEAPETAPVGAMISQDDLDNSYKAFDHKYTSSLGKSRKELEQMWGFPMSKLGENEREVAYGFRQRGIIHLPEEAAKVQQSSYYVAGDMGRRPQGKGKQFACLVILWVDKNGRGVVVDGEAVGDCFSIEDLRIKPAKFER